MFIVLLAAIFLAMVKQGPEFLTPTRLLLFFFAFPLLVVPIQIHGSHWHVADPGYEPFDPDEPGVPEAVPNSIRVGTSALGSLGFSHAGDFLANLIPNGRSFVSLYVNQQTHEIAKLFTVQVRVGAGRIVTTLNFVSEFADGSCLTTSNSTTTPLFPRKGLRKGSMSFPRIRVVQQLYEIHRASFHHFVDPGIARRSMEEDPVVYLHNSSAREFQRMVSCGYYYLDESNRLYRLTWKGAYLMVWKLIWPIGAIRRSLKRSRSERVLRELGFA